MLADLLDRREIRGGGFVTGYLALETHLPEIAPLIADFLDRI